MNGLKKTFWKKGCLLMILIFCADLTNLNAQETNSYSNDNTLDVFYQDTWAAAWSNTGKPYIDSRGSICFPNKKVVLARFEIFNYFFMPMAFENLYHSSMLDLEVMIEQKNVDLHIMTEKYKRLRKRTFKTVLIFCGIGILAGSITVLVIKR